jgi:protein arginine kinase activator
MTCELCGKENAVVKIRQIIGSESREIRICETCARERGIIGDRDTPGEGIAWLLQGLFERLPGGKGSGVKTCPSCGSRLRDIRTDRKVGCAGCYTVFGKEIGKMLKTGGGKKHRGKLPKRVLSYTAFMIDRENLKSRLEAAVEREDYELAAALRDKIRLIPGPSGDAE